jgi:hypothetical protein
LDLVNASEAKRAATEKFITTVLVARTLIVVVHRWQWRRSCRITIQQPAPGESTGH